MRTPPPLPVMTQPLTVFWPELTVVPSMKTASAVKPLIEMPLSVAPLAWMTNALLAVPFGTMLTVRVASFGCGKPPWFGVAPGAE